MARLMLQVVPVDKFIDLLVAQPLIAGGYEWGFEEGIAEIEARLDGPAYVPKLGAHCRSCEFRASTAAALTGLRDARSKCWAQGFDLEADAFAQGSVFDLYSFRGTDSVLAKFSYET